MAWTLDTPISTGDLDTGTYNEVKIVAFKHALGVARPHISIRLVYGNTVTGDWVPGVAPPTGKKTSLRMSDAAYDWIMANTKPRAVNGDPSDPDFLQIGASSFWVERTHVAVERTLYTYLENQGIIEAGTWTSDV